MLRATVIALMCLALSCKRASEPPATDSVSAPTPAVTVSSRAVAEQPRKAKEEDASSSDAQLATGVIHDYYRAISSRDYERAFACWGSSGPPGQSLDRFVSGFKDTATVKAETGTPSRVEPAAGSRYIEIPVTIVATTKSGEPQRFEGTYTLRKSVVDGASPADRAWHLYRASLRQITSRSPATRT